MSEIKLNNKPISNTAQRRIFGKTFEECGQKRRIEALMAFGSIGKELNDQFEVIRKTRNSYIHNWSKTQERIEEDAKTVFGAAVHLVAKTIGQGIDNSNTLILNPAFEKYLDKQGLIQSHNDR
jgi:hypothetical protein